MSRGTGHALQRRLPSYCNSKNTQYKYSYAETEAVVTESRCQKGFHTLSEQ
jgi:hypothetical protein